MEPTLDAALGKIFGGAVTSSQAQAPASSPLAARPSQEAAAPEAEIQTMIREANDHFTRAQQLLRQGDWNGYGEEVKRLGEVLNRMAAKAQPRPVK
jgi:uncharacterized membrane protein (UPF0182 family)